jgi:psiF repeat
MMLRHAIRAGLLASAVVLGLPAGALAQGSAGQAAQTGAQQQPSAAQAAQQDRMRSCNAEAGTRSLAGDDRRSFMSECLAGRTAAGAPASPSPAQSGAPRR